MRVQRQLKIIGRGVEKLKKFILKYLQHPLTRFLNIDDPKTTEIRSTIIQKNSFLKKIYCEWYSLIIGHLPDQKGNVLELGSGGGFLKKIIPHIITSDVFQLIDVDFVISADKLPFANDCLSAIVMTNVFHHMPDVKSFFREASRTIQTNGRIVMVEPWNTHWASFIYKKLHSEPFEENAKTWNLQFKDGPLSAANGALPWIVFQRDRAKFLKEFPEWSIQTIKPLMPVTYLLSGGVSYRSIFPGFIYPLIRWIESHVFNEAGSMFAVIVLVKNKKEV